MSANKLAKAITDSDLTILLTNLSDFPSSGIVKLEDEYILYAFAGDMSLLSLTRGFAGSSAAAHAAGVAIDIADIADLSDKDVSVKSYLTVTDEVLDITLPNPDALAVPQVLVVTHREDSLGELTINGTALEAGFAKILVWDGTSWTSEAAGGGGGDVTNPLNDDLDAGQFDITNVGTLTIAPAGKLNMLGATIDFSGDGSDGVLTFDGNGWIFSGINKALNLTGGGSITNGVGGLSSIFLSGDPESAFALALQVNAAGLIFDMTPAAENITLSVSADPGIRCDASATAGDTRFLLWDVDSGSLKRVKVTADDAVIGVTGRILYIDNLV